MKIQGWWVLFAILGCAGCGGGSGDSNNSGGQEFPDLGAAISCGQTSCTPGSQYCYQELDPHGNVTYSQCFAMPGGCSSCDCAEKDADTQESEACTTAQACSQNMSDHNGDVNNQITVQCSPVGVSF